MKKKIASLIAAFAALPLWAQMCGLIIGIMVLVVAGIVICQLYYVMSIVLPPNSPATNNIQPTWYYDHSSSVAPKTKLIASASGFSTIEPDGVPIQYGVCSTNGLPWISLGTNITCEATNTGYIGVIYTFENDSNCIDVVLATGGTLNRITYTATNGWTTNYPVNVFIQSSTNLTDWNTILDDPACVPDAVANFVDTNPSQPSNYYRIYYK